MKRYLFVFGILAVSSVSMGLLGQTDPPKNFENCAHWELIEQLRAYEDTLATEQSAPDTLRKEYGLPVTDAGISAKMYRLYRCAALLDSLANLQDSLAFVRADPPTVDSDSISGITGSAATLHGRILSDGGESVTARWFLYGTTRTALTDSIGGTVGTPDSLFTASISALTPAGTWYMAAFAKNAKGTSSGDTLTFTIPVAPTMDTDSISSITATAATFHGRTLSTGGAALSHRWFRYGTSAAALNDSIAGVAGTPDSLFTASVTSLAAGTYYVAAFGKNVVGTSSGDTLQFVVPIAPTMDTDSISSITASGGTFHGRTLSTGGAALSHRWFRYGTSAAALNDSIAGVAGTPDSLFTASVTSLTPGTYYVAAFGKNVVGTSSGDTLQFVIPVAPTMDTDSISLRTSTTATLHGKVVSNGGGALSHQWFRYGASAASLTDSVAVAGTATPFTVSLTGLSPATRYYFAAFGKNAAGTATGDTLSFWTKCSVDSVVYQGYTYGVIQSEDQCWFDENLQSTNFRDNTAIPDGFNAASWNGLSTPGRAEPNGDPAQVATYGRLYNWFAVSDARGLCPSGWHVPSEAAFDSLVDALGGTSVAGQKLKAVAPLFDGTDEIGYRAVPAGGRSAAGAYLGFTTSPVATFWSSTLGTTGSAALRMTLSTGSTSASITGHNSKIGYSVRCLQD